MRGFLHLVLALAIGAFVGWISARSMIENLPLKAVAGIDNWREYNGADELLLPYAVGHFSSLGVLPLPRVGTPRMTNGVFVRHCRWISTM